MASWQWLRDCVGKLYVSKRRSVEGQLKTKEWPAQKDGNLIKKDESGRRIIWGGHTIGAIHGLLKSWFGITVKPEEEIGDLGDFYQSGGSNTGENVGASWELDETQSTPDGGDVDIDRLLISTPGMYPAKFDADQTKINRAVTQARIVWGGFIKTLVLDEIKKIWAELGGVTDNDLATHPRMEYDGGTVPETLGPGDALSNINLDSDGDITYGALAAGDEVRRQFVADLRNKVFRDGYYSPDDTGLWDSDSPVPLYFSPNVDLETAAYLLEQQITSLVSQLNEYWGNADQAYRGNGRWYIPLGIQVASGSDNLSGNIVGKPLLDNVDTTFGVMAKIPPWWHSIPSGGTVDIKLWLTSSGGSINGNIYWQYGADWVKANSSTALSMSNYTMSGFGTASLKRKTFCTINDPDDTDIFLVVYATRLGTNSVNDTCNRTIHVHGIEITASEKDEYT